MRWILQNATQNFHVRILPSRERRQYNLSIASEIFSMINADEYQLVEIMILLFRKQI